MSNISHTLSYGATHKYVSELTNIFQNTQIYFKIHKYISKYTYMFPNTQVYFKIKNISCQLRKNMLVGGGGQRLSGDTTKHLSARDLDFQSSVTIFPHDIMKQALQRS